MFNEDQIPLTSLPNEIISPGLLHQLKSCWIETVEEMLSVTGILHRANLEPVPSILEELDVATTILGQALPQEELLAWLEPKQEQVRPLGNDCSEEYVQLYSSCGSVRFGNQIYSIAPPPLETSCDLSNRLLPVRDQGDRGVCVACTIASLMEYLTKSREPLSVDFIYSCCKMLDGYLGIEGTDLKTAMGAVSRFGICTESMYQANLTESGPSSDLMAAAAKNRVENIRQVLPGVIEDFKMKLSGAEDSVPMPVAVTMLVFDSTIQSPSAAKTGKWTLPIPGEPLSGGGHAMLVVGYQDDTSVPGGGYFIVRNSWGQDWASESLVGRPGHALIPYEYVQRFCTEAFTGPKIPRKEAVAVKTNKTDDFSSKYVFPLSGDGREYTGSSGTIGRLVKAGTPVIARIDRPDQFKIDTEENRKVFMSNDYSWDPEQRSKNLFPDIITSDWEKKAAFLGSSGCLFMESVRANFRTLPDTAFPVQKKRGWFSLRTLMIREVNEVADLSARLVQEMTEGVPDGLAVTERWREIMNRCNIMKIMRIDAGRQACFVAAAFVHPVLFESCAQPRLFNPTMETAEKVRTLFLQWLKEKKCFSDMNFMTLATCSGWDSSVRSSFDVPTVFTTIKENEPWQTVLPETTESKEMRSPAMRDFINRLSSETLTDKITKVRNEIDRKTAEHFEGNILVRFIAAAVGLSEVETEKMFRLLEETGEYEVYQVKETLAIKKR